MMEQNRDTYTLGAALTPERCKGTMYEHFVVVGVPTAEVAADEIKIFKPEILYTYPESTFNKVDPSVRDFAFPNGVAVRGHSSKVSSTDLLSIRFSSAKSLENPDSSFVFVMTTGNLLYGVCVYTDEILSDRGVIIPPKYVTPTGIAIGGSTSSLPSSPQTSRGRSPSKLLKHEASSSAPVEVSSSSSPSGSKTNGASSVATGKNSSTTTTTNNNNNTNDTNNSNDNTNNNNAQSGSSSPNSAKTQKLRQQFQTSKGAVTCSSKRCYILITRFPFFQLHFDVLYSLLARDRLYRQARFETVKDKGENKTSIAAGLIRQTLDAYYNQKIAEMGTTVSFSIPGEIRTVQFVCPPSDDVSSLADWCVACLLRVLSLDNIIKFFNAMVLEHRIALICSNLGVLSAVGLALIPLLRPLIWQGPFIPILPDTMLDILDAPFPLAVGLPRYPEARSISDFVIVDLDQNTVTPPSKTQRGIRGTFSSSSMIPLPDVAKLEEKLRPFTEKMYFGDPMPKQPRYKENPLRTTPAQITMVKNVSKLFSNYIENVLAMIRDQIILNSFDLTEENFDEQAEKVPALMPRTYRKFVSHIFQTQMFNFYSTQFLQNLASRQLEDELLFTKLQGLLEMEKEERAALEAKVRKTTSRGEKDRFEKELKACIGRIAELEKSERELAKKDPGLISPKRPSTLRGVKSGADLDADTSAPPKPTSRNHAFSTLRG